jgi:pimeloyl-ACP methyl ester carboxylesterase
MASSDPVRHLSYLSWYDPDAWMEKMRGKKWEQLLKQEKSYFNEFIKQPDVAKHIVPFTKELEQYEPMHHVPGLTIGNGSIHITLERGDRFKWKWAWDDHEHIAYDIDVLGQKVWYITTDVDGNHYKNAIICETPDCKILWRKSAVAQQVFVHDGLCYYIKVEHLFRTVKLCCCNADTGANERTLYVEKDERRDLTITVGAGKCMYLKSEDAGETRVWRIDKTELHRIDSDTEVQKMLGRNGTKEDQRIVRLSGKTKQEPRGDIISTWHLPDLNEYIIEYVNLLTGSVITKSNIENKLWYCGPHHKPKLIFTGPLADISPNPWTRWEESLSEQFVIRSPIHPTYILTIMHGNIISKYEPFKSAPASITLLGNLHISRGNAVSLDRTKVPYAIVSHVPLSKVKGLIVYVYGAYGSGTNTGWVMSQWGPLIKRGWAISFAFVRGGGDKDDSWADAARLTRRHKAIEDFEAVIEASQKDVQVEPDRTVVFGRSAGGLPVGSIASRHPYGDLAGVIFTEVPYVDLLRTQTNPDLPLTPLEYNEFGNPVERVIDFAAMLKISPVDQLQAYGAPGVFVLARTGLNDRQVYPYEPFKWIKRLRGDCTAGHGGKLIGFADGQAHFYRGPAAARARAIDLAILESWLIASPSWTKKNRSMEYKMARRMAHRKTHKGKKHARRHTRKNNKSNKSKKN